MAGGPAFSRQNRLQEPHDNDFTEAHAGLKGVIGATDLKASLALVRHQISSRYDATLAPPAAVGPGPAAFDDLDNIGSVVAEATLSAKPAAAVQGLAGGFFASTRQDIDLGLTASGGAPSAAYAERRRDRLDEAAMFGQATLPITRTLSLTVGGRIFNASTQTVSHTTAGGGAIASFEGRRRQSGVTPKLVLAYAPADAWLFYVQAAEGYRTGGFNTTGSPGQTFSLAGGPQPERTYQGDELWSFEAGARASLVGGALVARGAVFDAQWKNIQSDQLLASGLPFTANIGDAHNLGVEFESAYRQGAFLLRSQFLVNGPELTKANPTFPNRPELGLAGAPAFSGGLSAHYGWSLANGRRFEVDGRYAYIGSSRLTFDALTSPPMGGYGDGRIAASLVDARWRATLAIDNPADAKGDTFAYGNPFTLRMARQTTPLRPRTLGLTLSAAF